MEKTFLIVGAGFAGAVLARELVEQMEDCYIEIIDERDHIAGNCHTEKDEETGIMIHKYGPHIFHTSREDVWAYVNRFAAFGNYINRVKAVTEKGVFSLPLNLLTINQFFAKNFSPSEARVFFESIAASYKEEPRNFEEQALKFCGKALYENFFYGYTKKQWGCEPTELPASILQRLPIRFNYDDNYYNSKYQGIPLKGYTDLIQNMLNHSRISIVLNKTFESIQNISRFTHIFYSGPIDKYFKYCEGALGYRTIYFEKSIALGDFQGNAVINYTSLKVPHTRVHEHKHFTPWENFDKTVVFKEYSKETEKGDVPFYPKRLTTDKIILAKYFRLAENEKKLSFIGRLGTYRYLDMHQVIGESLDFSKEVINSVNKGTAISTFPVKIN
ncbi:MAG: UDP-galactopyranose mutase [Agriterribacter sp.]